MRVCGMVTVLVINIRHNDIISVIVVMIAMQVGSMMVLMMVVVVIRLWYYMPITMVIELIEGSVP